MPTATHPPIQTDGATAEGDARYLDLVAALWSNIEDWATSAGRETEIVALGDGEEPYPLRRQLHVLGEQASGCRAGLRERLIFDGGRRPAADPAGWVSVDVYALTTLDGGALALRPGEAVWHGPFRDRRPQPWSPADIPSIEQELADYAVADEAGAA